MINQLRDRNRKRLTTAVFFNKFRREPSQTELTRWCNYLIDGHTPEEMLIAMANFDSESEATRHSVITKLPIKRSSITLIENLQFNDVASFFSELSNEINLSQEALTLSNQ